MTDTPTAEQPVARSTTDLALEYLDAAWNRLDMGALDALASPGLQVSYPLIPVPVPDLASFKQILRTIQAGMPDLHFDFRHVATAGDTAVFRWVAGGDHTGPLLGIAATGRAVRWSGLSVVEVSDGRVIREWGEEDALGLFRQLGVVHG